MTFGLLLAILCNKCVLKIITDFVQWKCLVISHGIFGGIWVQQMLIQVLNFMQFHELHPAYWDIIDFLYIFIYILYVFIIDFLYIFIFFTYLLLIFFMYLFQSISMVYLPFKNKSYFLSVMFLFFFLIFCI